MSVNLVVPATCQSANWHGCRDLEQTRRIKRHLRLADMRAPLVW